ncbi:Hypothetical predicted protein [Mytilus galloprovincialis]|uniref:Mutator-like transposase domain-containing protein n=1 Tax=Mytilus galloprovincialis TaxID=29158 RepID=A0A8B6G5E0_MYTGA|nr:Hypothetical predicted protein [Mytilus galloprovincialis]
MAARSNGRFTKAGECKRRIDLSVKMKMIYMYETDNLFEAEINEPRQLDSCIWIPGERRVFEPYEMDKQLKAGCVDCELPLQFTNVTEETKCGLGCILYVACSCGVINKIYSGKVHYDAKKQKTRPIFDVNSKAAVAMYDTGLGPAEVNRYLANLNINGMSQSAFKKREKEVYEPIRKVAQNSLDTSLEEEKSKSPVIEDSENGEDVSLVTVKYDMGWQKRGSGRKYDSKSGVGTLIGDQTGKVVGRGIRSSDCRVYLLGSKTFEPQEHKAPAIGLVLLNGT